MTRAGRLQTSSCTQDTVPLRSRTLCARGKDCWLISPKDRSFTTLLLNGATASDLSRHVVTSVLDILTPCSSGLTAMSRGYSDLGSVIAKPKRRYASLWKDGSVGPEDDAHEAYDFGGSTIAVDPGALDECPRARILPDPGPTNARLR